MAMYGDVEGVQALLPNTTIDDESKPSESEVEGWLTESYAIINRYIGNAGYVAPVVEATAPQAYSEVTALNNLYAAAYVLRAQAIDTASGEGEERSEVWLADFWARLKDLAASNLSLLGISVIPVSTSSRPRRIRTLQGRRIDGYSRGNTGERWEVVQGEYTGYTTPAE
jgi:hypothetical protein